MQSVKSKPYKNLTKRLNSFLCYLWDFKIIYFGILYICSLIFALISLRNSWRGIFIGFIYILFALFLVSSIYKSQQKRECEEKFSGGKSSNIRQRRILLINISLFTLLPIILGYTVSRYIINREQNVSKSLSGFTLGYTSFDGYIVSEPVRKHTALEYEVKILEDSDIFNDKIGKIIVRSEPYLKLEIGEVCNFYGKLVEPKNIEEFDYITYLKNKDIFLVITNPVVRCSGRFKSFVLHRNLVRLKKGIISSIENNLKEPQSSLLAGILLGEKRLFSSTFEENIRISGISHIVAASGYNITILLLVIDTLFAFVPKKLRIVLCLIIIWCFCILAGMSSSIVRACIMATISLLAMFFGKNSNIHITFVLCIFFFVLIDPKVVFDVGFQLSISATAGLIYLLPSINNALGKVKIPEIILTTLSCTVSTLPVSIYTFKTLSLWSIPANSIILPVIESTMLFGVLGLLFSSIFLFKVVYLQLKYVEMMVNLIGFSKFGHWNINNSVLPAVIILFSVLFFCIYYYPISNEEQNFYIKIFDR
jgi:competence protein ComEC